MTDIADELDEILNELDREGIGNVRVRVEIEPYIRKQLTGETVNFHQEIRERVINEDELEELAHENGWAYSGTIDLANDFWVIDRFRVSRTMKDE